MNHSGTVDARARWLGLSALCAGMFMIITDGTVVNVALPTIKHELGFAQADLAWVVNAFVVPFGGLLLLAGKLGDLVGRKRVFLVGLVAFTLASLLCGLSGSQGMLIAARFAQGVAGALCAGVVLGKITTLFTEPRDLGKAFGLFSFVLTSAGAVGLVLGGVLTELVGWNWIFFINLPVGAAATLLAVRCLDDDRGPGLSRDTDFLGALLVTSGLVLGVYTMVEVPKNGWGSGTTLGLGAVAAALLAAFVVRQLTAANPIAPPRLFRSRRLSGGNALHAFYVAAALGVFFVCTLFLQSVLGYSPLQIGLTFLPMTAITAVLTLYLTPRLIVRYGERTILLIGLVPVALGLALLARAPVDARFVTDLLPSMILLGAGGLVVPALTATAMADAPPEDSGLAGGLVTTMQQTGGAIGVAVLAAFTTSRTADLAAQGRSAADALAGGYHLGFAITTGFVLTCLLVAAVVLPRPARAAGGGKEPVAAEQ
uniref:Putative transmembrane efflux protein n=1 Tax=Streptomyces tenjimariensis TaxID=29308 RepID=Q2UZC9_9ACTN|nr:putative transmembrane efflux protein [Streptomyces tenjimariensis]